MDALGIRFLTMLDHAVAERHITRAEADQMAERAGLDRNEIVPTIANADERLRMGDGPLWEVRVMCDLDETDSVDFVVRAKTAEEAADRAEEEARRFPDFYFDVPPTPTYVADRANIYPVEEDATA